MKSVENEELFFSTIALTTIEGEFTKRYIINTK